MREPYRTLLAGYEDHPILGPYLLDDEPNWVGLATDEKVCWISTGEMILIRVAHAFAGRDRSVLVSEVINGLDAEHRWRVAQAILLSCQQTLW